MRQAGNAARPAPKPANWRGVAACMREAKAAYAAEDFAGAEKLLLELIEFAPNETRAWKLLAHTQKRLGKIRDAIASAERALELQRAAQTRAEMPASLTLARLLWQQGDNEAARAMLAVLLLRDPDNEGLKRLRREWSPEEAE